MSVQYAEFGLILSNMLEFNDVCFDDVVCWNSMIDGSMKCEDLVFARLVFDKMIYIDVIFGIL